MKSRYPASTVFHYMRRTRTYSGFAAIGAAAALLLSACGGSTGSSGGSQSSAGKTSQTVSIKSVDGVGNVLVDSKGSALYSPVQEGNGKVLCTGSCTSIWIPLSLHAGQHSPTASSNLITKLGVVKRPGGTQQVTFKGRPLYRFSEDMKPGTVSGNNVSDSFGGKHFTWHVASSGRISSGSGSTSTVSPYGY
jgi:predicted lipoprotein with Yx(FWY)xxD motif